jgi:hypothetical protein
VDAWREQYNTARPHQALNMCTPAERFADRPVDDGLAAHSPTALRIEALQQPRRDDAD